MPQIYASLEVKGAFVDISKGFNHTLHEGVIYKTKCVGVNGDLLVLFGSF